MLTLQSFLPWRNEEGQARDLKLQRTGNMQVAFWKVSVLGMFYDVK